jgi:hypothetical protein
MGNRATVIFTDGQRHFSPAIYLHWNGGPESVYQFLDELDRRKVRGDDHYYAARFVQVVGEFFDQDRFSGLSLGISNGPQSATPADLQPHDPGDNGIYLVCRSAAKRTMRRFTAANCDALVKEWAKAEVERERVEAYQHEYMKGGRFRAAWDKQHGEKPTELP